MQSQVNPGEADNIRIWIAIAGCLFIVGFLFSPLPHSPHSSSGAIVYMVSGNGLQWLIVMLSLLTLFLICYKQYLLAPFAAISLSLTTLPITWNYVKAVFFDNTPAARSLYGIRSHFDEPGTLQIVLMLVGLALLLGVAGWAVWCEWNDDKYRVKTSARVSPRHFDPRTVNPQATTGYCHNCGAQNLLSRNQCVRCNVNLPWFGASAPATTAQRIQRTPPKQEFFKMVSIGVDWSVLAIGIISFLLWPLGLILFFAYSKTDDEKANAAVIGAGLALALIVVRFIFIMATAAG